MAFVPRVLALPPVTAAEVVGLAFAITVFFFPAVSVAVILLGVIVIFVKTCIWMVVIVSSL